MNMLLYRLFDLIVAIGAASIFFLAAIMFGG